MKRILLISYNFRPEPTGIGKYNGEMINWLADQGYECSVITSYPYYPFWKVQEPYFKKRFWYSKEVSRNERSGGIVTIHRCPQYVPSKPSGLSRIILDLTFVFSAFLKLLLLLPGKKFDYVITVAPSFQVGLLGVIYKKLRNARLLYHIQDLQIEAARDLKMIKNEKVIKGLFKLENFIFEQSDVISSISEGMVSKIKEKAMKETFLFPNWTDTTVFYPISRRDKLKEEFGFKSSDKIVLYSGAIGEKQGLEAILFAAEEMKSSENLKFVICGSGPYKENLISGAQLLNLSNVIFFPVQPFDKFNQFLNIADVHLVIQKSTASDLVMPSKLTTILAVGGLAIITANKGAGLHTLIETNQMGIVVDAENQEALNEGIRRAINEDVDHLCKNARMYAENVLYIEKIMQSFESLLLLGRPVPVHKNTRKLVPEETYDLKSYNAI